MTSDVGATAARLAERLPVSEMEALAAAILHGLDGLARSRQRAASGILRGAHDDTARLLSSGMPRELLAGALLGAACGVARERARQQVDVVWTGPHSAIATSRLTSAVVVDLIDSAHEEVLLVSYATQPQVNIAAALASAVDAGWP